MAAEIDAAPEPPVAPIRPQVREHHGDRVLDPYEWLRDTDDPAVPAYLKAENAYVDARTAHLAPLRARLYDEIKSRVQETDLSVPVASGPWWYYTRTVEGHQYAVHARCPLTQPRRRPDTAAGPPPGEQVLLDGNEAAGDSEFFAIGALTVSRDHARLAYAVDRTGDERFDLVVRDLDTGAVLDNALTGIGYGVEFAADGQEVFYTRLDEAWRPYQVWRHRVGTDPAGDVLTYQEDDERFWLGLGTSRDERWLMLATGSKLTTEVRLLPADRPEEPWQVVAPRREGLDYDVEPAGDRLLIVHNRDHLESDLAWAPLTSTSSDDWRPLLASGPGERFLGVDAFDDALVLSLRRDGLPALRVIPRQGDGFGDPWDVTFPEPIHSVALADNPESAQREVLLTYESFITSRTMLDLDLATGAQTVVKRQPVLGGFDATHYAQHRAWATSADGTSVPVSIVTRADAATDGRAPGLLTAYGAYEIASDPYFSVARLSLLDRGVVFAVAHVRGGGEMGRHWYDDGKLLAKQHSFDDTISAARLLVADGWVAPDRLGLEGGSAGGLLAGAVTNQAPELFAVVHAAVPFVDALTTMLRPDLPLTIGEWEEWGNPLADPQVYAAMKAYTPYENIAARPYPSILATSSLHDTRVFVTEPAKWVARLRATVTNDPAAAPILLRTEMAAGHGGRSGRYAAWEQIAWEWAFVLDRLGAAEVS